jgi:hypothetical protein
MSLKTSDEKQDLILKVFDYFETESKLSLGESEIKACKAWAIYMVYLVNTHRLTL